MPVVLTGHSLWHSPWDSISRLRGVEAALMDLYDRIDYLKKAYRNLRKIGVSPWADVAASAEIIGGDYVLSRKPNPAHVADRTDPALIRKEISETVELCLRYGCPCDITLKDISTVGYRPENLILWAETASAVLDEYYGED